MVNPEDTQTITVYNDPIGGVEILKVDANRTSKRIPNTTFEISKMDDELIDTVTTGKDGRVFVSLENGTYYAVETEAAGRVSLRRSHTALFRGGGRQDRLPPTVTTRPSAAS